MKLDVRLSPNWLLDLEMREYRPQDAVDFCIIGTGAGGGVLAQRLARFGFSVVALEAGALDFMKQYAAERGALAFISREDLTHELASGRLVEIPLREGPLTLEMDFVYLPDADRSPAVRAFMDMLEESTHEDWSGLTEATPSKAPRRPKGQG